MKANIIWSVVVWLFIVAWTFGVGVHDTWDEVVENHAVACNEKEDCKHASYAEKYTRRCQYRALNPPGFRLFAHIRAGLDTVHWCGAHSCATLNKTYEYALGLVGVLTSWKSLFVLSGVFLSGGTNSGKQLVIRTVNKLKS